MAQRVIRETVVDDDAADARFYRHDAADDGAGWLARIVYFLGGLIVALLALRFVLALLGANTTNAFAQAVYTLSHPFVAPFFGLFNYQPQYGASRFEVHTLVAIVVFGLLTALLGNLLNGVGSRRRIHY
jgi:uncharacterized protein YggT (Ycf19 family)